MQNFTTFQNFQKRVTLRRLIESKPNDIITLKEDNFFKKIDQFKRDAEKNEHRQRNKLKTKRF